MSKPRVQQSWIEIATAVAVVAAVGVMVMLMAAAKSVCMTLHERM